MKNLSYIFLSGLIAFVFSACSPKEEPNTPPADPAKGSLTFNFNHTFDGAVFIPNQRYATSLGDTFNVNDLAYYVSNIKLTKDNNEVYSVPNSYHFIRQTNLFGQTSRLTFKINVPPGNYKSVTMSIGVDSARNFRIDQVGDLDPNSFMAWDWNIGYKYFLMEGRVFDPDSSSPWGLVYHIGELSNYRTREFMLTPGSIEMAAGSTKSLNITLEVDKIFSQPNQLDLNTIFNEMGGPRTPLIADNYINAFKMELPANNNP